MAKYTLTIEAPTLKELIERIEEELAVVKEEEKEAIEHDRRMNTRIIAVRRRKKRWDNTEIEFLIDHYRTKNMKWIAAALGRPLPALRNKLFLLYKEHPEMPKLKRNGKVIIMKNEVI